jgi:hypothetical protein
MPGQPTTTDEKPANHQAENVMSAHHETSKRVHAAALLLIAALVAGPVSTHAYWLLGGSWGAL